MRVKQFYRGVGCVAGGILFLFSPSCRKPAEEVTQKLWPEFSGETAFSHVQWLVELGPRPPGSPALEKARTMIAAQLTQAGWTVARQTFEMQTPRGPVVFVNLVASFGRPEAPVAGQRFLVCTHYDTKVFDDATFVGANDAGSGTGALIEIGRVLSLAPALAQRVDLVFFDGEEAYLNFTATDGLYGSRFFAEQITKTAKASFYRGGILLDMIGDRSLTITLSPDSPPFLAAGIFAAAEALGVRRHFTYFPTPITDDHVPLTRAGIPTIDLIDFEYTPWHTPEDTLDKIDPESLAIVSRVTLYYLQELAFK